MYKISTGSDERHLVPRLTTTKPRTNQVRYDKNNGRKYSFNLSFLLIFSWVGLSLWIVTIDGFNTIFVCFPAQRLLA